MKYLIYELSVSRMLRYAKETDDRYELRINNQNTRLCINGTAPQVQDDCALFYQIMLELYGERASFRSTVSGALKHALFFADFSGVFDRQIVRKHFSDRQAAARDMFRPEGIVIDLGKGHIRYRAFERSGSMSRDSRLSFIRADLYHAVKRRIQLGMDIGVCQLSKLYAYNGLMLTSGKRIEADIWNDMRIAVVQNTVSPVYEANIVTVEDDGTDNPVRKYSRIETSGDIKVTEFDGEGIISAEFAEKIDKLFCGKHIHSSFQIRMPYIKGVAHEVDIKSLFSDIDVPFIIDIWGVKHPTEDLDMILTESMFKGLNWMEESGLSWKEYVDRCREYRHGLYVSGVNKLGKDGFTELNYQFLNTVPITGDEFRPKDLPYGWDSDPKKDKRHWVTKYTEAAYYGLSADEKSRQDYFISNFDETSESDDAWKGLLVRKNPLFLHEPMFCRELDDRANKLLEEYSLGKLIVKGENRYLSGDLMRLLKQIIPMEMSGQRMRLEYECCNGTVAYAPGLNAENTESLTLLRNPHIARNEEAMASKPDFIRSLRGRYLSHLDYTVMVDSRSLIPERLGGADFDGDMVKIITDPLINDGVRRSFHGDGFDPYYHRSGMPILKIPSAEPLLRDANDWQACFETVRNTFSTRIGQICNAALNRSIIAYDENTDSSMKEKLMRETETLEILTGLEIDSVKSGVKPDLREYLGRKTVGRSVFLKYKELAGRDADHEWYEPTKNKKLEDFFRAIDWESITSNVERLPYLARMLKKHTPRLKPKPASDGDLFKFARKKDWQKDLPEDAMHFMRELINSYEEAARRIRMDRNMREGERNHQSDIERILFTKNAENEFSSDELYAAFSRLDSEQLGVALAAIKDESWQLLARDERESFLERLFPIRIPEGITNLLCDFSHGGYRILGDIILDLVDDAAAAKRKAAGLKRNGDVEIIRRLFTAYELDGRRGSFEKVLRAESAKQIEMTAERMDESTEVFFRCAVALGKREFALCTMPKEALATARKRRC